MKLAFLINTLGGGGAEKQLLLTATGLARLGHECVIFTLRGHAPHPRMVPLLEAARAAGVEWVHPPMEKRLAWSQVWRLRGLLSRQPETVLWTWGYRADVIRLLLLLLGRRPRAIVALRSADEARLRRYRPYWRLLQRWTDAFVSNSWLNLEQLEAVAPGAMRKGTVIYNALDGHILDRAPVRLGPRPDRLRIVMLGNVLIQIKGYDLVVPLAERIREAGLPFTIHIGGMPFEAAALQALIDARGLGELVHLEGLVGDPLAFLSAADVFLMLSRVEGMPNALLEAMSLGLPAVCTRVGDVPRFARDREHLRLVGREDVPAAFEALRELWTDWAETTAMARRGRDLCRASFTEQGMLAETNAFLKRFESRGLVPGNDCPASEAAPPRVS